MDEHGRFTTVLDEKLQIIRNHVRGGLDEEMATGLHETLVALLPKLKNPGKVKILVFLDKTSDGVKGTPKGRRMLMEHFKRPDLYKMAVVGGNPYMKALATFVFIATGVNKVRLFSNEHDAVQWLNE
jgi:hypothetical protein